MEPVRRIFRVLVADDDESVRCSTAEALGRRGMDVETAADGLEAVRVARRFRPDVGVLDLEMPRLDGLSAADRIRAAGLEMRVVIVSSAGTEETVLTARRAGIAFLAKPIDMDDLWSFLVGEGGR